ncbi:unnamed protein product [Lota lota]
MSVDHGKNDKRARLGARDLIKGAGDPCSVSTQAPKKSHRGPTRFRGPPDRSLTPPYGFGEEEGEEEHEGRRGVSVCAECSTRSPG